MLSWLGVTLAKRARTVGALNRRFERDRAFQHAATVTGPAVTPADSDNASLSLRYGTFPAKLHPRRKSFRGIVLLWGANAGLWASLSDKDASWLFADRIAIGWSR